jgi:hypothetical protein
VVKLIEIRTKNFGSEEKERKKMGWKLVIYVLASIPAFLSMPAITISAFAPG